MFHAISSSNNAIKVNLT